MFATSVDPATELTIRFGFFILIFFVEVLFLVQYFVLYKFGFVVCILIGVQQLELLNEKYFDT